MIVRSAPIIYRAVDGTAEHICRYEQRLAQASSKVSPPRNLTPELCDRLRRDMMKACLNAAGCRRTRTDAHSSVGLNAGASDDDAGGQGGVRNFARVGHVVFFGADFGLVGG